MHRFTSVWARSALFVAVATASASLYAKEENAVQLSNVVVSAAGYEQSVVEAPASISVITAEELRSRPYTNLLDAVKYLEGVDVGETNDKTGQGTVSIRGMGSDYTLVLINGRRQNNHGDIYPNSFGGNQFNNIPPLDAIERIEVIRGPASTLYGADAMGGVINIITKAVSDKWTGSASHGRTFQEDDSYGNDITTDFYASGPLVNGVLGLAVRGSIYNKLESNPDYSTESVQDPLGVNHSRTLGFGGGGRTVDNENTSYGATLTFTPTSNQKISFDIDRYKQVYDNNTRIDASGAISYPLGTVDGMDSIWRATSFFCDGAEGNNQARCENDTASYPGIGVWTERADPRVGYAASQEFTRETMSLTHEGNWSFGNSFISLQQVTTNNNGRTLPFSKAERDQLLQIQQGITNGTKAYADLTAAEKKLANEALESSGLLARPQRVMESKQTVLDVKMDMPFEWAGQHTLVVGGQVIQGELTDGVFGLESGTSAESKDYNMWSVFAEDTWYVLSPLAITAGVRYDKHEDFGGHLSPRLYAVYNLTQNWTVKGGVSTGFKAPKTTDMYDGVTGFGGQGTSPMYGNSDLKPEISTSTEVALYWQHPVERHSFNVTVFQNKFDDKITSAPCSGSDCTDVGQYEDLGYTLATKKVNADKVLIEGVEVAGRLQIFSNVGLSANYTYTDSEQDVVAKLCPEGTSSCANAMKVDVERTLPYNNIAKHMVNATLDWQASDKLKMFLTMEMRSDRYAGLHTWSDANYAWDSVAQHYDTRYHNKKMYFKNYEVFHLGFNYQLADNITLNGRVNNLLDRDFTTYSVEFENWSSTGVPSTEKYENTSSTTEINYIDDYNNKDKRRNYWLSLNVTF